MPMVDATPNREVQVDISVGPNGVSDNYSVMIPDGEIVSSLDFKTVLLLPSKSAELKLILIKSLVEKPKCHLMKLCFLKVKKEC